MRYSPKQYALAILDLMTHKKAEDSKIAKNFLKLLEKNGDIKKAKHILVLAEALYFKKTDTRKITIETARKIKNVSKIFAEKGDVIEEKINPDIIAGLKIIINGEKQLDFSLKNRLEEIFN